MTEQEAIKRIKECRNTPNFQPYRYMNEALDTAINALEEIQQYRAIGTVVECRVAVEKQKEAKPIFTEDKKFAICPSCNGEGLFDKQKHCDNCGQKIDWSEERQK